MKLHCAVLDDYQNVAMKMANWSVISDSVVVDSFNEHIQDGDQLVRILKNYEIIIIMRERTPFSSSLLSRLPS